MVFATLLLAVLSSTSQLTNALVNNKVGEAFNLSATAISCASVLYDDFAIRDDSGRVILTLGTANGAHVQAGDLIHASGTITRESFGHVLAKCTHVEVLRHTPPRPSGQCRIQRLLVGRM